MVLVGGMISIYMVYGSVIKKNYPTQAGRLCLRLTPELKDKMAVKAENWVIQLNVANFV